jgi:isoquinoline 1-oxidoreductase alpha subunit
VIREQISLTGMIMAAAALLAEMPKPSVQDVRAGISNIGLCGTYNRVQAAIQQAAGTGAVG